MKIQATEGISTSITAEAMPIELSAVILKMYTVFASAGGAYLLAESANMSVVEKSLGSGLLATAVATLWWALKVSYEGRLSDKDELIDKHEDKIQSLESEIKELRSKGG